MTRRSAARTRPTGVASMPPGEADYYRNGGIMQYVLRGMLRS
jgi:aconitase A